MIVGNLKQLDIAMLQQRMADGTLDSHTLTRAYLDRIAAIDKAGSTDPDKIIAALEGLTFDTPLGKLAFRAADHQSTMGAFVGKTTVQNGKGVMVDWTYLDGGKEILLGNVFGYDITFNTDQCSFFGVRCKIFCSFSPNDN